jgi:hypothetical protein
MIGNSRHPFWMASRAFAPQDSRLCDLDDLEHFLVRHALNVTGTGGNTPDIDHPRPVGRELAHLSVRQPDFQLYAGKRLPAFIVNYFESNECARLRLGRGRCRRRLRLLVRDLETVSPDTTFTLPDITSALNRSRTPRSS